MNKGSKQNQENGDHLQFFSLACETEAFAALILQGQTPYIAQQNLKVLLGNFKDVGVLNVVGTNSWQLPV